MSDDDENDLETLMHEEKIMTYEPTCIRKNSNWSKPAKKYRFDDEKFDKETLLNDIPDHSPKLETLLKKIEELDKKDKKKHGKLFKHFIFSDVKSASYGARLLASALIAKGMNLGYNAILKRPANPDENKETDYDTDDDEDEQKGGDGSPKKPKKEKRYGKIQLLSEDELLKTNGENFYLLSSISVYDQNISVKDKKEILRRFNQRPENTHGELARIIVMDSGFKEGIDLFDVKYVHIFEPSVVPSDQKQVIGRSTRTCGQLGLDFHPTRGWPLYVYVYDLSIPEFLQKNFLDNKTTMELYLKTLNIDVRLHHFSHDLEKTTVLGSVDYDLNKNIHSFSIPNEDDEEETLPAGAEFVYGGELEENEDIKHGGGPKKRLILRGEKPAFVIPPPILEDIPRMKHDELRKHINDKFSEFAWDNIKMENMCSEKKDGGAGEIMKYTPTQDFIKHFFTPSNPIKGMLLNHSVGTGKTCTAIATATSSFEKEGYTILWVTRTTLKNDIWKNMFEQVCNENISHQIQHSDLKIPDEQNKRIRLLSKSWRIRPMSYKQFSNLVSKKNALYKTLVKINGEVDPLRKTLLIIDEAHKLYGGGDLSSIERPDMNALHQSLMNSYLISGRDSVKLLLMTATPITQDPMELIKLLNLCRTTREQLPTEFNDFSADYLNELGEFTEEGRAKYLDDIAGYVSYLNREKDARQFAQPQIEFINTPITDDLRQARLFDKKLVRNYMDSEISELKEKVVEKNKEINDELNDLDPNKFMYLKNEVCGEFDGKYLKECEKIVKFNIKQLVQEAKDEIKRIRDTIKEMKETIKARNLLKRETLGEMKENIEKYADDYEAYKDTMLFNLKNKCSVKITENAPLQELIKEHPTIQQYDQEINEFNGKIAELQQRLRSDMVNYKKRIEYMKQMLKNKELNDLEKRVIRLTIKDERKTVRNLVGLKRKETLRAQKEFKKSIQATEKLRKRKFVDIRKTLKNRLKQDKKEKREIATAEKKLRKTLRKQGEIKEEINDELLKQLLSKYRGKIYDNLLDIDTRIHQEELEKEEKVRMKEKEKQEKKLVREREREEKKQAILIEREEKKRQKEADKATRKAEKDAEKAAKLAARKTRKVKA